jgi:DNA (cytosine-5)-methyltransferase 1
VDCFCGAGGLSLGLKAAGFEIGYAFDNDEAPIKTYAHNMGPHAHVKDIKQLDPEEILTSLDVEPGEIDLVAGGPPCQGFSVQRRGADKDERNHLVGEYLRVCSVLLPRFVLMENVGGILSKRGKSHFMQIVEGLEIIGYKTAFRKLHALQYGVPQDRRRVFLVAERVGEGESQRFDWPTPQSDKVKTVKDAIWDLRRKKDGFLPNHRADKLSAINIERIRSLKPGQGRDSLPEHLQLPCHRTNSGHRHLDTYGRMDWSQPAPTITARFDSFSRGRFGHPEADRTITLREGARLQTFPDDFEFFGTKVEMARQVGNAVPPLLAKAVGKKILESIIAIRSDQDAESLAHR